MSTGKKCVNNGNLYQDRSFNMKTAKVKMSREVKIFAKI